MPSTNFWSEVYRRRVLPIYRHHELVQRSNETLESQPRIRKRKHTTYLEVDGSITDGDDHVWLGDPNVIGGAGDWKSILSSSNIAKALGKQERHEDNQQREHFWKRLDNLASETNANQLVPDSDSEMAKVEEADVINLLIFKSPPPIDSAMIEIPRSSSPIAYGSGDEDEVSMIKYSSRHLLLLTVNTGLSLIDTRNIFFLAQNAFKRQLKISSSKLRSPIPQTIAFGRNLLLTVISARMLSSWFRISDGSKKVVDLVIRRGQRGIQRVRRR
jgi:hypothetical protein